jgi:hypothetical protein
MLAGSCGAALFGIALPAVCVLLLGSAALKDCRPGDCCACLPELLQLRQTWRSESTALQSLPELAASCDTGDAVLGMLCNKEYDTTEIGLVWTLCA